MIRDVGGSYRRAIVETVHHFGGLRPEPSAIDGLKAEGRWNNDWEASLELLRRQGQDPLPAFTELVEVFNGFYFGGDPEGDPAQWRGFIGSEPLLVDRSLFDGLSAAGVRWGFVSGAEPPSARFVLEQRLGLATPPLIAMGDAPDKPDPTGLLRLAEQLLQAPLGAGSAPVAYLGDTVADVLTVARAREQRPQQRFISLAVPPPHLQAAAASAQRERYGQQLRAAGADRLLERTDQVLAVLEAWLA
ncbi:MAG: TIGR01548 family HAD-type hydrolase [Vulcanococcus sp.]